MHAGEPKPPVPSSTPYVPRFLNDEGKREWRRLVRLLVDLGLYTTVDRAALAMYCQAWGRWVEAERVLAEQSPVLVSATTGNLYQNPMAGIANKSWEQVRKMLAEFGLTPSSRARLHVAAPEEEDELAQLLFRRGVRVK